MAKGVRNVVEEAEIAKQTEELAEAHKHDRFNRMVAITVAVLALTMVLGKVKDSNLQIGMLASLTEQLDNWNYYQARSLKQHQFELQTQDWQLKQALPGPALTPAQQQQLAAALALWQTEAAKEATGKADLQKKAEAAKAHYDALREQDHSFHFSEALLTLAITLFAVSALVKSKHLYGLGLAVALVGFVIELGGFLRWNLHLDFLRFLT
jgi:hypothetical protein